MTSKNVELSKAAQNWHQVIEEIHKNITHDIHCSSQGSYKYLLNVKQEL